MTKIESVKSVAGVFRTGIVQFDVQKGQIQFNIETVFRHLEDLASRHVQLAVLPEMFSCSFDNEHLARHAKQTNAIVKQLCLFAGRHQMAVAGSLPVADTAGIFNTMFFIDTDGRVKGEYRKIHLFRLTDEHLYYTPGNRIVRVDSSFGRIGLMICYDLRFPELARSLCLADAGILLISAQWPDARQAQWEALIQARCIENQLFMVAANRTGEEDGLNFQGGSMICGPTGDVLARAHADQCVSMADIRMVDAHDIRATIPCLGDRREDIYG